MTKFKKIFFNHVSLMISIAASFSSIAVYADTTNVESNKIKSDASVTSTQPGVHLDQSKNIFFEQFSSNTYALQVLQAKNTFNNHDLIIGGSLETDWQHWHGNKISTASPVIYDNGRSLYFTQATLDIMGNPNLWLTEFLSGADGQIGQPAPNGNNIFLNHAFLILGNLDTFPIYLTLGINTIPFGVFSGSGVWDTPLTGSYFNPTQAPLVSIAYFKDGLNMSATKFSDETNHQNHNVFSIYYNKSIGDFNYSLGVGYLTDLKSNSTGSISVNRSRRHHVPSGLELGNITDVNASIGYGQFLLSGEYDQGSNNAGINTTKPKAMSITVTYTHDIAGRDATFGISRSKSLHLKSVPTPLAGMDGIPLAADGLKNTWALSASRPFFSNNISLGVNFEKNETYLNAASYTGTVDLTIYV